MAWLCIPWIACYALRCLVNAVALSPEKSSLAAEKLKESLREEGVLEQLVFAGQHHATQQGQDVTPSRQADAVEKYAK